MSEGRLPSPDFDRSRYERPNKNWVCGHACDGSPCRIGPSPSGKCRATTECFPELELKQGEETGTWRCTRPKEWGGPCADGPLPDGTCCRAIAKCQPTRSLRSRRGLVTRITVCAAVAVLLVGLGGDWREDLLNPAPLSTPHSDEAFARHAAPHGGGQGCVTCHAGVHDDMTSLLERAVRAARTSLQPARLVSTEPRDFSAMDAACMKCHRVQSFHQPNVARDPSCSTCHREHQGANRLLDVPAMQCTACHGDEQQMVAAARKGRELPAEAFARNTVAGLIVHGSARPADGYTRVIRGFTVDHPEFRPLRAPATDTNPLKFNHRVHLTGDIPPVNGKALDCAYCHKPDASGAFMQRISFEQNCRACHALSFDSGNPSLVVPHGDPARARAFLRSLPTHYADLARSERGLSREEDIRAFVTGQIRSLRSRALSGENLERAVFFGHDARAKLTSCTYCHEVAPRGEMTPAVTPPAMPDRWLTLSTFSHASHRGVACQKCHAAEKSTSTADILLPTRASCTECHSPKGGAAHDCSACHRYHNDPPPGRAAISVLSQQ